MVAAAIIDSGNIGRHPTASHQHEKESTVIITTRPPASQDAAAISQLVREVGTLEPNTTYAYLLLCAHFSDTSAIAEADGRIVGCVLGYRIPDRPRTLFVWQIGVHESARRTGVGRRLLSELVRRPTLSDVEYLETTIAPSNAASRRLFERWANLQDATVATAGAFESSLFGPAGSHEQEEILRIGPLKKQA